MKYGIAILFVISCVYGFFIFTQASVLMGVRNEGFFVERMVLFLLSFAYVVGIGSLFLNKYLVSLLAALLAGVLTVVLISMSGSLLVWHVFLMPGLLGTVLLFFFQQKEKQSA
ncbi:MAG: hypothetical protein AB2552_01055 [Candidatus Thiodiazotropha endolucinida]